MKKLISIVLSAFIAFLAFGCNSNVNSTESEAPKGEYNIAYITIPFLTTAQFEFDSLQDSYNLESGNDSYQKRTEHYFDYSSGYYSGNENLSYYCKINDWEYGKNDTIILYLIDGRTIQTSTENVLLMYEPVLN